MTNNAEGIIKQVFWYRIAVTRLAQSGLLSVENLPENQKMTSSDLTHAVCQNQTSKEVILWPAGPFSDVSECTPTKPRMRVVIMLSFSFSYKLKSNFFAMADGGKAASKEINLALKAAKEAIKQKEYKEALKHCKVTYKIALNSAQLRPVKAKNRKVLLLHHHNQEQVLF